MIRTIGLTMSLAALAACGDGRGSPYSSARAQQSSVAYVPVTPGAVPVTGGQTLSGPIAVTPGAVPIQPGDASAGVVQTTALAPAPAAPAPAAPAPAVRFATGPIYSACLESSRSGASQQRCGCVQWVADRQLDADQQRRGATFFTNQHGLQEVRQSDGRSDAEFWTAWKAFGASAGDMCRNT